MKHTCDHAGMWDVELDVAAVRCGFEYTEESCLQAFGEEIIPVEDGTKWFIPSFIEEQYGEQLNPQNKVHASVISILKKFELLNYKKSEPLGSPIQGATEGAKDKYIYKDKEKDKDNEGGMGETKWTSKPKANEVGDLPAEKIHAIQVMLYGILRFNVAAEVITGYWQGWKEMELTGQKFYHTREDVYRHFSNSIKQQKFKNEQGDSKQGINTGYKAKLAAKLAGGTGDG